MYFLHDCKINLKKKVFLFVIAVAVMGHRSFIISLNLLNKHFYMLVVLLDAWCQADSALWNYSRPFARPSLNFLNIGSLVLFNILHDNSWPWYLVTDKARFLMKKKIGPNGPQSDPKLGFLLFSWVWIISFHQNCIQW